MRKKYIYIYNIHTEIVDYVYTEYILNFMYSIYII